MIINSVYYYMKRHHDRSSYSHAAKRQGHGGGGGSSREAVGEAHDERSNRKKIEKLRQCTIQLEEEIQELDRKRHQVKRAALEAADKAKAEFMRAAAPTRRERCSAA